MSYNQPILPAISPVTPRSMFGSEVGGSGGEEEEEEGGAAVPLMKPSMESPQKAEHGD